MTIWDAFHWKTGKQYIKIYERIIVETIQSRYPRVQRTIKAKKSVAPYDPEIFLAKEYNSYDTFWIP